MMGACGFVINILFLVVNNHVLTTNTTGHCCCNILLNRAAVRVITSMKSNLDSNPPLIYNSRISALTLMPLPWMSKCGCVTEDQRRNENVASPKYTSFMREVPQWQKGGVSSNCIIVGKCEHHDRNH